MMGIVCLSCLLDSQSGSASISTFVAVGKQILYPCLLRLLNFQTWNVSTFLSVGKQILYPCLLYLLNSQTGSASVSTFLTVGKQTLCHVPRSARNLRNENIDNRNTQTTQVSTRIPRNKHTVQWKWKFFNKIY